MGWTEWVKVQYVCVCLWWGGGGGSYVYITRREHSHVIKTHFDIVGTIFWSLQGETQFNKTRVTFD